MDNYVHANPRPEKSFGERLARLGVEEALDSIVARAADPRRCPPRLGEAIRYAVFPGGARLRPMLLAAVGVAAGGASEEALVAACAAVELLHCASLAHDDLACFDDAATRRGRPALPRLFGQAMGVLVGDALIVLAFQQVADLLRYAGPTAAAAIADELAAAAGAGGGLVAGQAWEMEESPPLDEYHRAKTGSLFTFAARAGAILAGASADRWGEVGALLGKAYQAADDVADATSDAESLGKPTCRDEALARPNVVRTLGVERARARARQAVEGALAAVPDGPQAPEFRAWLGVQITRAGVIGAARI